MGVIFRPTGPRPLSEFTVNIPDPSDKIRNQGLEVLRGWRQKSQYDKRNAQELLNALQENYKIESEYRRKAYEAHRDDNKRIAGLIDKNFDTQIQNLRTKADNDKRKWDSLAKIAPAVGTVLEEGDRILDEMAKKAAEKKFTGPNSPPPESTKETEDLADANTKAANDTVDKMIKQGMSPGRAYTYANITSGREKKWFLRYHDAEQGKQAVSAALSPDGAYSKGAFKIGTEGNQRQGNYSEYKNYVSTLGPTQFRFETAKMWDQKINIIRERYSHVSDENFSKFYRPHFAAEHDAYVNKLQRVADKNAERNQPIRAWQAVGGGYADGISRGLTPIEALTEVRNTRLKNKASSMSDGDVQRQLTTDVITGIQARGLPLTIGEKYLQIEFIHNDGQKTTIGDKFPHQANAVRDAIKARRAEEDAETEAFLKSQKIAKEAAFYGEVQNLKKDILANPTLNVDQIGTRTMLRLNADPSIPDEVKIKVQKYLKNNVLTVDQHNVVILEETFQRGMLNESLFEDDIMQWPIAPSAKIVFIDRLKARGGDMNNSVRAKYKGYLIRKVRQGYGIRQYGQATKDIDPAWDKKIVQAELNITRAARGHYLAFKGENISSEEAWNKAYTLAYREEFEDVWKERKEEGNFWEATSVTDSPGIKLPKNIDPVEQNPIRVIREKVEKDDFTIEGFINDGDLDNEFHMQSEMFKLQYAIANETAYTPSHYVQEVSKGMGLTPEKFTEIHTQKHNNAPTKHKIDIGWEQSTIGRAEAALDAASPAIQQLKINQVPSPEATEIVFAYQILTDLGIDYGDISQLSQHPELFKRFTSLAARKILERGVK